MLIDGAYATPTVAQGVVVDDGDGHPEGDGAYRKSKGLNPHEGTVAIVTGHGGAGLTRRGTMPIMREIIVEHGSVILDIKGDTLTGTMVNKNTVTRDLFSIVKQGKVEVTHLEKPWQPSDDPSQLTVFVLTWKDETAGQPPSNWRVVQGSAEGVAVNEQKKLLDIKSAEEPTVAVFEKFSDTISGFHSKISLSADSPAPAGLVFAYQDEKNYDAYLFDAEAGTAEFVRYQGGEQKVLDSREVEIDFGKQIKVEIEASKKQIEFQLNDQVEYHVNIEQPLPTGKLGAYVGENGAASYGYFAIQRGQP